MNSSSPSSEASLPLLRILTCEDTMDQLYGLHNPVATITSIPMLAMPLWYVYKSFFILPNKFMKEDHENSNNNNAATSTTTLLSSLRILSLALFVLFLGNVYFHIFETNRVQVFARSHSYYVFTSAYVIWNHVLLVIIDSNKKNNNTNTTISLLLLPFFLLCIAIVQYTLMVSSSITWEKEEYIYKSFEGILNPFIVLTMGYASWKATYQKGNKSPFTKSEQRQRLQKQKQLLQHSYSSLFSWWLFYCVGSMFLVILVLQTETLLCFPSSSSSPSLPLSDTNIVRRFYHAMLDHTAITNLFYHVVGLHFTLVEYYHYHRQEEGIEMKKKKQ